MKRMRNLKEAITATGKEQRKSRLPSERIRVQVPREREGSLEPVLVTERLLCGKAEGNLRQR
jgi:transposase-like protein